jgi:two-component system response regulator PilR (NtrC family)
VQRQSPGYSVLIVEDDASIRRLVTMVLAREGFVVDTASDGAEALGKLGVSGYDVIVLDLMMPNLDGFTLMSRMSTETPERLRSVIVTSAASPSVIRDRMGQIPFDVLPKPFDIGQLAQRVRACVDARGKTTISQCAHTVPTASAPARADS